MFLSALEQRVGIIGDVDYRVLLQNLNVLLQELQLFFHPGLSLALVERVCQQGEPLVGLIDQRPVATETLSPKKEYYNP